MSTILSIILTLAVIAIALTLITAGLSIAARILGTVLGFLIHYWLLPLVLAGLSYWIFERFWLGLIIGLVITLLLRFSVSDDVSSSSSSSSTYTSPQRSSSSSYNHSSQSDSNRRGEYDRLMSQAEDALSEYRYYKSKAEDALRQADIERSYGEQYSRSDDEMDQSYARECFSKEKRELDEAREYARIAENYYDNYKDLKHRAECER